MFLAAIILNKTKIKPINMEDCRKYTNVVNGCELVDFGEHSKNLS